MTANPEITIAAMTINLGVKQFVQLLVARVEHVCQRPPWGVKLMILFSTERGSQFMIPALILKPAHHVVPTCPFEMAFLKRQWAERRCHRCLPSSIRGGRKGSSNFNNSVLRTDQFHTSIEGESRAREGKRASTN